MNLALINPRVWLEIAVVAILVACGWYGYNAIYDRGAEHVQVKWDAEKKEQADAALKVTQAALATTKSLQESADKQREATNAQIITLNANLGVALAGLRERPTRASAGSLPPVATVGAGGTGASLWAEDGSFLVREASRADTYRLQLIQCQAKYTAAIKALN